MYANAALEFNSSVNNIQLCPEEVRITTGLSGSVEAATILDDENPDHKVFFQQADLSNQIVTELAFWGIAKGSSAILRAANRLNPGVRAVQNARLKLLVQDEALVVIKTKGRKTAVVTGIMDRRTGKIFIGKNADVLPDNLHPLLRERLKTISPNLHPSVAGTHSEIYALNDALNARGPGATLDDLVGWNVWTKKYNRGRNLLTYADRCKNCGHLTDGVEFFDSVLNQ